MIYAARKLLLAYQHRTGAALTAPMWRQRGFFERWFTWPWRPLQRREFLGTYGDLITETMKKSDVMRGALVANIYGNNALLNRLKEGDM